MNVRIKYCVPCGYRRHAERLAELFQKRFEASVTLEKGSLGVFKIWRNNQLVFDKRQTRGLLGKLGFGTLPSDENLVEILANVTPPNLDAHPS